MATKYVLHLGTKNMSETMIEKVVERHRKALTGQDEKRSVGQPVVSAHRGDSLAILTHSNSDYNQLTTLL